MERILESKERVATTSINLHEVLYGLEKYGKPTQTISSLPTMPFDKDAAALSSKIEADLEKIGRPVQRADAMIAAVTIKTGARLYTYNIAHFERMESFGLGLFK